MQFGLVATTMATAVIPLLLMPLPILALRRKAHLAVGDVLLPQVPTLLAAAAMAGAVALLRTYIAPHMHDGAALPVLIAAGAVLYPVLVIALMPWRAMQIVRRFRGGLRRRFGGSLLACGLSGLFGWGFRHGLLDRGRRRTFSPRRRGASAADPPMGRCSRCLPDSHCREHCREHCRYYGESQRRPL